MRVFSSNAEVKLALALQREGIRFFGLGDRSAVPLIPLEDVAKIKTVEEAKATPKTVPDLWVPREGKRPIPIYLDGEEVHSSNKSIRWDAYVDEKLREIGYDVVLRFKYKNKLSDEQTRKIVETVKSYIE